MLRPSAFQNNGNSGGIDRNSNSGTDSSSSKSILRPSSFQLATANSVQTTTKSDDEPSTTSATTTVSEATASSSSSPSSQTVNIVSGDDDGKISSTTNNNTSSKSIEDENVEEQKSINPFNSSKVKNASDDDDDTGTEAKANNTKSTGEISASSQGSNETSGSIATTSVTKSPTMTTPLLAGKKLSVPNATNLFAAAASKAPSTSNGSEANIGFVFGQNIHERIIGAPDTSTASSTADDAKSDLCSGGELFAAAAAAAVVSLAPSSSGAVASSSTKSNSNGAESKEESSVEDLTKAAREYEESRAQKRKYDEVQTFTGEENEVNVLDVNSKLFAFVASNWEERGPGGLRLNDSKDASGTRTSRVVFRTSGNLRVVLNTKVWKGMVVEKSSQKSLRLTAIDSKDGQIKIFLAMARPDDINSLYSALQKRIEIEKEKADTSSEAHNSFEGDADSDEPDNKIDKRD